jgi:predicted N-formylglutamate amidohydrolase
VASDAFRRAPRKGGRRSRGADGYERIEARRAKTRFVLTCEHASQELPPEWSLSAEDGWLRDTHWAYDLGAAELTRELADASGAPAVLSRISRLLVDANRAEDSDTLIRQRCETRSVGLNRSLGADERERRLDYWRSYHRAVDQTVAGHRAPVVLSLHSFTPVYQGQRREVALGILYDGDEALARELFRRLEPLGVALRYNQPYSGQNGMIYSVERHARAHGRGAVEIEVRQDLASDPLFRRQLVALLADW